MAIMIPDSCPGRATVRQERIYGRLRDPLPDNSTAWYGSVIQGRDPDFTQLADSFGHFVQGRPVPLESVARSLPLKSGTRLRQGRDGVACFDRPQGTASRLA